VLLGVDLLGAGQQGRDNPEEDPEGASAETAEGRQT
jgi:hypothetical protein